MKSVRPVLAILTASLLLAACGKASETTSEKLAEKLIESQMTKDGTKANVDLSSGAAKITTTDASGKTATMELGGAKVSEADLGIPFYPGSSPVDNAASRMVTPDGVVVSVTLNSSDPADKVADFYRDKLRAQSQGKQFMDMGGEGEATLMVVDGKSKTSTQVHVAKADNGSEITIVSSRKGAE